MQDEITSFPYEHLSDVRFVFHGSPYIEHIYPKSCYTRYQNTHTGRLEASRSRQLGTRDRITRLSGARYTVHGLEKAISVRHELRQFCTEVHFRASRVISGVIVHVRACINAIVESISVERDDVASNELEAASNGEDLISGACCVCSTIYARTV